MIPKGDLLVSLSKRFSKQYDKAPVKVRSAFDRRLSIFVRDQFHPQLNNHPLIGRVKGYRSINVTGDWRGIYSVCTDPEGNQVIVFEMLGTHSQLYK